MVQVAVAQEGGFAQQADAQRHARFVDRDGGEAGLERPDAGADFRDGAGPIQVGEARVEHARGVARLPFDGADPPDFAFEGVHGEGLLLCAGAALQERQRIGIEMADQRRLEAVVAQAEDEQVQAAFLEDLLLDFAVVAQAAGAPAVDHDAVADAFLRGFDEVARAGLERQAGEFRRSLDAQAQGFGRGAALGPGLHPQAFHGGGESQRVVAPGLDREAGLHARPAIDSTNASSRVSRPASAVCASNVSAMNGMPAALSVSR